MRTIALILAASAAAGQQVAISGQSLARPPVQPKSFDCAADGSVTNSVTAEPIVRAHVSLFAGEYSYSATSDSSGNWALANLACLPAQLQVTRNGFLQASANRGVFRPLNLTSGSPVHAKTELTPQSVAFGKVVDDQGDPIQAVQVLPLKLLVVDGRPRFQQSGGMGTTNDLGEYRISGLNGGKYIFCAHSNQQPNQPFNQQAALTVVADSCYPGPIDAGAASAMDVPAGREAKVDFTLAEIPAVHVRGTVTGLPEGRGSGVRIFRRGMEFGGNLPGNVRDGKFDFRVPSGAYTLAADYFENGMRLTARVNVDVGNADVNDLVVHLDTGFSVTGAVHVTSQSGQALTRQFGLGLRSSEPGVGGGQVKWDSGNTSFSISEMTPGSYRLELSPPPPFYVKSATLAGQDILDNEVPIQQAAGPIDIQLRDDGGSIEGEVTDSNGQAVSSDVMLLRGNIRVANLTIANGNFKLQNLAPGDYIIYAWADPEAVQYADPDWMRRNGTGGQAITITAGQSQQIKLVQQTAPE